MGTEAARFANRCDDIAAGIVDTAQGSTAFRVMPLIPVPMQRRHAGMYRQTKVCFSRAV